GVETGELFFANRKRHYGNVGRLDALVTELLVEGNIGVAVDGRHHGRLFTRRAELLDIGDDCLPIGVAEGRIVDHDVVVLDAFRLQIGLKNFVGGARINVVGTGQDPTLHRATILAHQIVDGGNGLLVRCGASIEHVAF